MPSSKTVSLAGFGLAGVALGTALTLTLTTLTTQQVNFVQSGTSSGVVLQVNSVTRYQTVPITCTASGGLTKYSMCSGRSPLSTTGSLIDISMECGSVAKQLTGDVQFKKSLLSNSGSPLTNLDNIVVGTGALERSAFATELKWNPADLLTFSTLETPTGSLGSSRYDCQMWATLSDKYGS